MMKPILLASAMLLAGPALAQVNANTGAAAQPGTGATTTQGHAGHSTGTAQHGTQHGTPATTGSAAKAGSTDTIGGTEGTTNSHAISSSTDGVPDTQSATGTQGTATSTHGTTQHHGTGAMNHQGTGTMSGETQTSGTMTGQTGTGGAMTGTSDTESTTATATAGAWTGAPAGSGAAMSNGFTGMGGPSGNLMDVAGEVLGDASRVERVLRGGDQGMKASDLLNAAMLTLIQSGAGTPR